MDLHPFELLHVVFKIHKTIFKLVGASSEGSDFTSESLYLVHLVLVTIQ